MSEIERLKALLESQAKALSEWKQAAGVEAGLRREFYDRALAAEARLAELSRAMTEVRDWLILAGDMTCREIPLGIIARTNAAKTQESKDA